MAEYFVILKNKSDDGHVNWADACEKRNVSYWILDINRHDWLDRIADSDYGCFLSCPPGREAQLKQLYDEKIYILDKILNKFVYPGYDEISLHENKRYLSFWLVAKKLPHPATRVFYDKHEALEFLKNSLYPLVGKFNIGASGKGVKVLKNLEDATSYVARAFSKRGLHQSFGPNLMMGNFGNRIKRVLKNPFVIKKKIRIYKKIYEETQKGFVILQEYIPHEFEWRVVKIGDSYFGHRKIKLGDKASGTKGIDYTTPPEKLLNFVKNICLENDFNSIAIDLFEDGKGGYLINEMQTIFGHVQEYICELNGKPGRFLFENNKWRFDEGMFNTNLSYDLRLSHVIEILKKNKK